MGFSINGNLSVATVAGTGPVRGMYNGSPAYLVFFEARSDLYRGERVASFRGHLKGPSLAPLLCDEPYFNRDDNKWYQVYAFERTGKNILHMDFSSNRFDLTQNLVKQCLTAVQNVHSAGYVLDNLRSPDSYVFDQVGTTISVKLLPFHCYRIGSRGPAQLHTKRSNVNDLAVALCSFFFGPSVTLEAALQYDPAVNIPGIRFVPVFQVKRGVKERAYTMEVVNFLGTAAGNSNLGVDPASSMVNNPVFWDYEKRHNFNRDGWEKISTMEMNEVIRAIDSIPEFVRLAGVYWLNFPLIVRKDLLSPIHPGENVLENILHRYGSTADLHQRPTNIHPNFQGAGPGLQVIRGSGTDFMRCLRNLLAHRFVNYGARQPRGIREYRAYDRNVRKGIDIMMSVKLPSFLISVYNIMRQATLPRPDGRPPIIDNSLECYLDSSLGG